MTRSESWLLPALLTLVISACSLQQANAGVSQSDEESIVMVGNTQCGVERADVKSGTDVQSAQVNLEPQDSTVAELVALAPPSSIPAHGRVGRTESSVFRLTNVTLVEFNKQSDSDYHLVLSDGTHTLIAEIPSLDCVGSGSPFQAGIQAARSSFEGKYQATAAFNTVKVPVTVTGVGLFDFLHGQVGVAANGIELHPLLSICFGKDCATGAVTPSAPTSSVTFQVDGALTAWGQNVFVTGDVPELGGWDPAKGVLLSPATYPSWTGSVSMAQGEVANFKFIMVDGSKNVAWEQRGNRQMTVPAAPTGQYQGAWSR